MWCHRLEAAAFSDAAVVETAKKYIWVLIDRDNHPGLPEKYNVSAYPSLLAFGPKLEKIFRFSGFRKAEPFDQDLKEGLRRWDLYRKGEEWDLPDPRAEKICDTGTVSSFKAPSDAIPSGLTVLGDDLWVGQAGKLQQLDAKTGVVKRTFELDASVQALCNDGASIYAVTSGWTAGHPIFVIDPATGKGTREIVTDANKKDKSYGARGIAWRDGKLHVLRGMEGIIDEVDPKSGAIVATLKAKETWLGGLDFDGKHFVAATKTHLLRIDPKTGETVGKIAMNYWVRTLCASGDSYFLMEQPVSGFDKENKPIQQWPRKGETVVYRLKVR